MRVGRRISIVALNTNINADLVLGCGYDLYANTVVVPTGCGVAAGFWFATNTDQYLQLRGGALAAGGGAEMILTGGTYAGGAVGDVVFTVPNAAATVDLPVLTLEGKTDTPTINAQTRRITGVGQATTDMDAAPQTKMWGAWTPTLTWATATPAALTTIARYCQIGKTVYFTVYLNSTDSNATTGLEITLPVTAKDNAANVAIAGFEIAGAAGTTYYNPYPYIYQNVSKIYFGGFITATDAQRININLSGHYEVA